MSLNRDMHPRNPYKNRPPDFKALALEFPEFRKHCRMSNNGKISLNFQEDAAVRVLTQTLLKKDFGLEVNLPIGTLVPRVPQRLNYCLLIEDLLKINKINENVIGIDIGTGASCIYALLGAKLFNWKFVATDGEENSVEIAHDNVNRNGLSDRIAVAHVDTESKSVLTNIINEIGDSKTFQFCMCNPPFFENGETEKKFCNEPSLGGKTYSNRVVLEERSGPHSSTFAGLNELEVEGGEVTFVNRIIDDSIILRDKISIYTSMLGRKQSVKPLRIRLERLGDDVKVMISTLNQGKTQRWILCWTFSPNIVLENSAEKLILLKLKNPGMKRLENAIEELDGIVKRESSNVTTFECRKVTWTHKRARRRAEARLEIFSETAAKRRKIETTLDIGCQTSLGNGDGKDSYTDSGNFVDCRFFDNGTGKSDTEVQAYFPIPDDQQTVQGIRFRVTQSSTDNTEYSLNFELLAGSKQHLNQLLQYLRNVMS